MEESKMKRTKEAWAIVNDNGHLVYDNVDYSEFCIFTTRALALKNMREEERVVKVTITYEDKLDFVGFSREEY
jgi:hypothetical protein